MLLLICTQFHYQLQLLNRLLCINTFLDWCYIISCTIYPDSQHNIIPFLRQLKNTNISYLQIIVCWKLTPPFAHFLHCPRTIFVSDASIIAPNRPLASPIMNLKLNVFGTPTHMPLYESSRQILIKVKQKELTLITAHFILTSKTQEIWTQKLHIKAYHMLFIMWS